MNKLALNPKLMELIEEEKKLTRPPIGTECQQFQHEFRAMAQIRDVVKDGIKVEFHLQSTKRSSSNLSRKTECNNSRARLRPDLRDRALQSLSELPLRMQGDWQRAPAPMIRVHS